MAWYLKVPSPHLNQLECLHSENTPPPPPPPPPLHYPYYWFILDPKSKQDKVKVTNFKKLAKIQILESCKKLYTQHTFGRCLIRCIYMKWIQRVLLMKQERTRFHPQTDRQTNGGTMWNWYTSLSTTIMLPCSVQNLRMIWQWLRMITHLPLMPHTVETLYNTVNFCWSTHKRHSIARPKGRGMGCLLWVQRATYCVDLSKLSSIKYLL